jgi:hypothetical protein
MIPTAFDEENGVLHPPPGVSSKDCDMLSIWRGQYADGQVCIISCWKLTKEELEEINKTGRVWLHIHASCMPPVSLEVKHPFKGS